MITIVARMAFESSGRGEFAKLVSDHVLSNVNRNELVPIMNCHCMADEVRGDHAGAGPGLHDLLLLATIIHSKNSLFQCFLDVRSFS